MARKTRRTRRRKPTNGNGEDKRSYVKLTPRLLLKAIPGTGGVMGRIAKNAGCGYNTAVKAFESNEAKWDECRAEFAVEKQSIGDAAEHTMQYLVNQRIDFATARKAAEFILSRKFKDRGYGDVSTLKIESDNPLIQMNQNNVNIADLPLPLKIKVAILEAIEKYQKENLKLIESKA